MVARGLSDISLASGRFGHGWSINCRSEARTVAFSQAHAMIMTQEQWIESAIEFPETARK
jgi:hypothetical protein